MLRGTHAHQGLGVEATARWAFRLSYFLLADRRDALSVLYQATARLYVTALTQKKREAKRPKHEVHKKHSLTPRQLLQYLIYLCAEPYETLQEREHAAGGRSLTVEDMIVRYVKHLMLLYLERNSFYATVGQSCVLFDFSTNEAGRLYETLVQGSPAHLDTKGDYSVRDAKREIRHRLAQRFGGLVTSYEGARREQRFVEMADPGPHFPFVRRCLHLLQPAQEFAGGSDGWHLPAVFDASDYDLPELQYDEANRDPRAEQAAESRRLHVVTHPCCWARLLRASCREYSRRRVVLPKFSLHADKDTDHMQPGDRRRHTDLTPAELEGLTKTLEREAQRRRGIFVSRLSVTVDGSPLRTWSPREEGALELAVEAGGRVLAVSAEDEEGEVLLAQYLLQASGPGPAVVKLHGGQEFTFEASSPAHAHAAGGSLVVTICWRESRLRSLTAGYLGRRPAGTGARPSYLPKLKTAAAVALLFVLLLAGWWATRDAGRPAPTPLASSEAPAPQQEGRQPAEGTTTPEQEVGGVRQPTKAGRPSPGEAATPPKTVLALRDGERLVTLDERGGQGGLSELPRTWREAVRAALAAGRVERPGVLDEVGGKPGTLLGGSQEGVPVLPLGPVGVVVESDRPQFRWRALEGASSYRVAVYDERFRRVAASGPLSGTSWTPPQALGRGRTYAWQLTVLRGDREVLSPAPPAPEAKFRVLEQPAADELSRARREQPDAHLTLGVLYARAGLAEEAEREFRALLEANPRSAVARSLLRSVEGWRR